MLDRVLNTSLGPIIDFLLEIVYKVFLKISQNSQENTYAGIMPKTLTPVQLWTAKKSSLNFIFNNAKLPYKHTTWIPR